MSSFSKKTFVLLSLSLVLIGGGTFFYLEREETAKEQKIEIATVTRGSLQETVSAQGKLEPKDYVDVGVQISGQLKKLHVEIGDIVKQGDLLGELDPLPYESKVAADEAKLNSLRAQLTQKRAEEELAQLQFKRAEKLTKLKAISDEDFEAKNAAIKVAAATVQALQAQSAEAEANLQTDKINLGYTKIYAPMDGIVSDQLAREGQTLNANQTTPTLVQIANMDVMTVRAQVAEADVMRLKTDMKASFAPLGALERKWVGTIRQILPTPDNVNDVVLYDALIDSPNEDRQLMNGMSVQVFFEIARTDNALILPKNALGQRIEASDSEQGKAYEVRVKEGDREETRTVFVGMMTRTQVEIREGLYDGDRVITQPSLIGGNIRTPGTSSSGPRPSMGARL